MTYQAGSASVSITPSFEGFHRKIGRELGTEDAAFARAGDRWGKLAGDAFSARLRTSLARLPAARIRASADTARAKAELDATARTRTARVRVDVDRSALSRLGGMLGGLPGKIPSSVGSLPLASLIAVVPAVEALLPEVTALASGFAAAGAGAGAFALLAKPAFGAVGDAYKSIGKDQAAYDNALTKTAKSKALAKLGQDWKDLDPAERGAVRGLQGLSGEYRKISTAFEPAAFKVFNAGLKLASDLLPKVTPFASTFAGALTAILGHADKFAKSKGFGDWLKQFQALEGPSITAIGDGIGKVANSVGKLLTTMSAKDVVNGINIAFTVLNGTIQAVTYMVHRLMTNWDGMSSFVKTSAHDLESAFGGLELAGLTAFRGLADVALTSLKDIVHGAADAFGWVPGVGGKLKEADAALGGFKTSVDRTFDAAIGKVGAWKTALDNAPKTAKLKGNISDLTGKLASAERQLKNPDLTKTRRAAIEANIGQLQKQIASARAQLDAINGKTVYTEVYTTVVNALGPAARLPGHAAGTGSAPPGWAWVGERGPELMRFRGGEQVIPAQLSAAVASRVPVQVPSRGYAAGTGMAMVVSAAGNDALLQAIVQALRFDIQGRGGGNVQAYLGQR